MTPARLQRQGGAALIIVLWVVALMGTIAMIYMGQTRLTLRINDNMNSNTRAELLAEAGIYRAMAILVQDREMFGADHLQETWNNNQAEFFDVPLGDGLYRVYHPNLNNQDQAQQYGAMDECGKLNINEASMEQLMQLPNMTEPIAAAIIDWRDDNDEPEPNGAESNYYMTLPEPYEAKNAPFDSPAELLLVRDIDVQLLYGEDMNTNGMLEINENDGDARFPIDDSNGELDMGWYPYITTFSQAPNIDQNGEPRINLNEASEDELQDALGDVLDDNTIEDIVEAREDSEFESITDLLTGTGGEEEQDEGGGQGGPGGGGPGGRGPGGGGPGGGEDEEDEGSGPIMNIEPFRQIVDRITVSGEDQLAGRININTAPETVLRCLLPNNPQTVEAILAYRQNNGTGFTDIGGLFDVQGVNQDIFVEVADQISVKSSVFSVRAAGQIERNNALKEKYAVIDRSEDPPQILFWKSIQ